MRFDFSGSRRPAANKPEVGRLESPAPGSRHRTTAAAVAAPSYYHDLPSSTRPSTSALSTTARTSPCSSRLSSPPSLEYDNGTGTLGPSFIHDQGWAAHVRTTEQIADFIRWRNQVDTTTPTSPSIYSTHSSFEFPSDAHYQHRTSNVRQIASNNLPRQHARAPPHPHHMGATHTDPMSAGIGRRYRGVKPVTAVLPGATRQNQYEGFRLSRGTMRNVPAEAEAGNRKRWWSKAKEA